MSSTLTADDLRPEQTVLRITIIEDDCDDSEFLKEAFQELSPHHRIHCFKTADAFFSHLNHLPTDELPGLIITDLNIPVINGITILQTLSQDHRYAAIPKVVYSHSSNPKDLQDSLAAGALIYLKKPNTIAEIRENAREMLSYCR